MDSHVSVAQPVTISRNSMDRFDYDLSELVLSYLPIASKIQFRSICRTWNDVIFTKVDTIIFKSQTFEAGDSHNTLIFGIDLKYSFSPNYGKEVVSSECFGWLLTKTINIRTIVFGLRRRDPPLSPDVLVFIRDKCNSLTSVRLSAFGLISTSELVDFCQYCNGKISLQCYVTGDPKIAHAIDYSSGLLGLPKTWLRRDRFSFPNISYISLRRQFSWLYLDLCNFIKIFPNVTTLDFGHIFLSDIRYIPPIRNLISLIFSTGARLNDLEILVFKFPNLEVMHVEAIQSTIYDYSLQTWSLPSRLKYINLKLTDCSNRSTFKGLFYLLRNNKSIVKLVLNFCPVLSTEALMELVNISTQRDKYLSITFKGEKPIDLLRTNYIPKNLRLLFI